MRSIHACVAAAPVLMHAALDGVAGLQLSKKSAVTGQPTAVSAEPTRFGQLASALEGVAEHVDTAGEVVQSKIHEADRCTGVSAHCSECQMRVAGPLRKCDDRLGNYPSHNTIPKLWNGKGSSQACNLAFAPVALPGHCVKKTIVPCAKLYGTRCMYGCAEKSLGVCNQSLPQHTDRHFPPNKHSLGNVGGDSADVSAGATECDNTVWVSAASLKLGQMCRGAIVQKGDKQGEVTKVTDDDNVMVRWDPEIPTGPELPGGKMSKAATDCKVAVQKVFTDSVSEKAGDLTVIKTTPSLFSRGVHPDDVRQGSIGNCWMMAAMATLATVDNGRAIIRLFETREKNPRGIYVIRLFDVKRGHWRKITVDDKIPCDKPYVEGGAPRPKFVQSSGAEMWPMLLEKAFSKLCGTYVGTEGGHTGWAMRALTGGDASMWLREENDWARHDFDGSRDKFEEGDLVWRFGKRNKTGTIMKTHPFAHHALVKRKPRQGAYESERRGVVIDVSGEDVSVRWHGLDWRVGMSVQVQGKDGWLVELPKLYPASGAEAGSNAQGVRKLGVRFADSTQTELVEVSKAKKVNSETIKKSDLDVVSGQKVDVLWHAASCKDSQFAGCAKGEERTPKATCTEREENVDVRNLEGAEKRKIELDGGNWNIHTREVQTNVKKERLDELNITVDSEAQSYVFKAQRVALTAEQANALSPALSAGDAIAEATPRGGPDGNVTLTVVTPQTKKSSEDMFPFLRTEMARGAVLACSGVKSDGEAKGLVKGHAYSILNVVEDQGQKLIQVRNPWATGEWKGDWSDKSEVWDQHQALKAKYLSNRDDGAFWMSWDDFKTYWGKIELVEHVNDITTFEYEHDENLGCAGPGIGCITTAKRFVTEAPRRLGYLPAAGTITQL